MVTAAPRKGLTYEEYVSLERTSDEKHEFVAGQLFAMSGAKRAHNSTERYDRGAKFEHYQTIPSFQEYVLASSSKVFEPETP